MIAPDRALREAAQLMKKIDTGVRPVLEDDSIDHVADNMAQLQVRRLPVMDSQKRLIGIVSVGDLARASKHHIATALHGISRPGGEHNQNRVH